MPGENDEFEKSLISEITGHEEDSQQNDQDEGDDQQLPPDPENDEREQRREQETDDDDQQLEEDDGLDDLRSERDKRQDKRDEKPKDNDKDTTTVVADIFDPKAKFKEVNGSLFLNGKQVARAGRERRNFEAAREVVAKERKSNARMAGRLQELADAGRELLTRYTELDKNKNMFEKADLTFDDQKLMFDVAVEYKKNPINGIKLLLTKAKLAGVDIASLGVANGGIDVSAIVNEVKSHIDERFKPVENLTKTSADQNELAKQVDGFYARNPEAEEFAETLDGGHVALAGILKKARETDIGAGREPKTLDEYWSKLHYEILKRGGITRLVTKGKEQEQRREPRRRPRAERRRFNGDETMYDIGQSVLADIRNLT